MAAAGEERNFIEITSEGQYGLVTKTDKMIIIGFYSPDCPACVTSGPGFEALATSFSSALFLRINVEQLPHIAEASGVSALPTFQVRQKNKILEQFSGADLPRLRRIIEEKLESRLRLGSLQIPDSYVDLLVATERNKITCLNEDDDHDHVVDHIWDTQDDSKYLKSDAGEQLLIHIPFRGEVKIHSLKFGAPNNGHAPKTVALFVNQPHLDISDAEDARPVQKLKLSPASFLADTIVPLDFVLFQKVHCLSLFIEDNQGDEDETILSSLLIIGVPPTNMDMSQFKRVSGKKGESHD